MRVAVSLMDGLGLDGDRCIRVIPQQEEVSFFGHRWNSTGISPDPKKTESILKMQFPSDKKTIIIIIIIYLHIVYMSLVFIIYSDCNAFYSPFFLTI